MSAERKCISLSEAIIFISLACAIIVDDEAVTFGSNPEDEDLFLELTWVDENGDDHKHQFLGVSNMNVNISGPFMYLLNTKQEEIELHLLDSLNIEERITNKDML